MAAAEPAIKKCRRFHFFIAITQLRIGHKTLQTRLKSQMVSCGRKHYRIAWQGAKDLKTWMIGRWRWGMFSGASQHRSWKVEHQWGCPWPPSRRQMFPGK
jgi:hypothetical protein